MNPTGQPMGVPAPVPTSSAKEALNVPSLLILVLSGLGALFALSSVAMAGAGSQAALIESLLKMAPNLPQEQRDLILQSSRQSGGAAAVIQPLIMLIGCAFAFYGALQMRAGKSFGLAMASAILVMLPCGSNCCCCVGLPVGIWALVVLNKPEVKSAFSPS